MKKCFILCLLLVTLSFPLLKAETNPSLEKIDYDQLSETFGHLIVRHLMNPGLELDFTKVIKGIQDAQNGKSAPLSEEEYEQAIYVIQENLFLQTSEKNLSEAQAFLKSNSQEEGIQILDSHLQYRVTEVGRGMEVKPDSEPLIHYTGKLIDGSVFATSEEDNKAVVLPLKQTIPGFAKGLVGMREGEKRTLYIHPELAYGLSGHLPPNSLLIFEVEVVKADTTANEEIAQTE